MKDTECECVECECVCVIARMPELHAHEHISKPLLEDSSALLLLSGALWVTNATVDHITDSISNKDSKYARSSIAGGSSGPSLQHLSLCWEGAFYKSEQLTTDLICFPAHWGTILYLPAVLQRTHK